MRSLLVVLLLAAASVATAAGPRVAIITSEFPPPLVQRAADELKADLKRLYDADVQFGATVVPGPPAQVILLGMPDAHGHLKQLGTDGRPEPPERKDAGQPDQRRNTTQALCPPNPNEFETPISTCSARDSFGT